MIAEVWKTEKGGRRNITELLSSYSWSGDFQSAVRELEFKLLSSPADGTPGVILELGDPITLDIDGVTKFAGNVVFLTRQSEFGEIDVRCQDRGRILKGNKATYQFKNTTAEAAVGQIGADWGIEIGETPSTGISLTRNFVGTDIFSIILTMFSLASEQNQKKYVVRFDGLKLCVFEKAKPAQPVRICAKSNLMDLSVTESIENLVNRVQILNKADKVSSSEEDSGSIEKYGLMQEQIKESDTAAQKAKQSLRDKAPQQKITVNNLGDIRCLTGTVVELSEPHTGLVGDFYIDSDTHTWKRGQYYNKLVLNFKNIMSEKDAGKDK
ncbi:MAG: hypothetical protein RR394_08325 [Oscillospiraceae bacterium]